jgi:radical SAM superfamily enzyme YgiQ (UPF0313 family)
VYKDATAVRGGAKGDLPLDLVSVALSDTKLLLVNPPAHQIVEPVYDCPKYPRTSLACLAGYLRERDIDVHVLDCKYDRLDFTDALDAVQALRPDLVGFCGMTNEIKQSARLAGLIKAAVPGTTTVVGDVHVSALPEQTLREFPEFDYGVVGEGEETLFELMLQLSADGPVEALGVCHLTPDGEFAFGGERPKISNVAALPLPAWDMFRPAEEYIPQTSRGCPFACNFCMNPGGRLVRDRTPEQVTEEIEMLLDLGGIKSLFFGDEIFTVHRERAYEICQRMIERGIHRKITWSCQTHVNAIDRDLAVLMREANCEWVGLGIESGDEAILRGMGKGTNRDRVMRTVDMVKEVGLPFHAFIVLGQPDETIESARMTIDLAIRMNPDAPVFGIMVPYPGTEVARMAAAGERGYRLLSTDWNDYNKQIGNALGFEHITRKQLQRLQMMGYLKVYLFNFRILEALRMAPRFTRTALAMIRQQLAPAPSS